MTNFKQLKIWLKGFQIAVNTFKFAQTLPDRERYGLSQQMTKAAVSISSNIAEGSSRSSSKDYHRFIEIALGSSFELETQLLLSEAVNYGNQDIKNLLLKEIDEEQKMLISFMNKLKN
ncbi:MAG: four helix bundle protein [Flavisolibacter sp.]|jgi:four helix bundle protein